MRRDPAGLQRLRGGHPLVVASTGGHLEQAWRWAARFEIADRCVFVTFRSSQAEGLLRGKRLEYVDYIPPRGWREVLRSFRQLYRIAAQNRIDSVLSTGAGIGLAAYVVAMVRRVPFFYIESVSRFDGPSLTGKVLARLPSTSVFTQHRSYASNKWRHVESLLADYRVLSEQSRTQKASSFFVTLGTIRPYRFDALVDTILALLGPDDSITWQLGCTDRSDLPGVAVDSLTSEEFDDLARSSDVVVTHSGVGSVLRLLDLGVSPIVVPRRQVRNEHVDDHQEQVARAMAGLGLVVACEADELTSEILRSSRPSIVRVSVNHGNSQSPNADR